MVSVYHYCSFYSFEQPIVSGLHLRYRVLQRSVYIPGTLYFRLDSMTDEQPPTCPVCAAGTLGAAMIRDCHLSKKTTFQIAAELQCSNEAVMRHINESHELTLDDDGDLQSPDKLLNDLLKTLKTLKQWTDFVVMNVDSPEKIDRAKVDMLVRLSQEARKTIESVATLQGRKGPGDTYIQMQVLNQKVMLLTNTVIDTACGDCKMKILEAIENQPLLMEKSR
jgi:hypothetical protein